MSFEKLEPWGPFRRYGLGGIRIPVITTEQKDESLSQDPEIEVTEEGQEGRVKEENGDGRE